MQFTAMVTQEGALYVAQCVEVDVASQGGTFEEATANLREAIALHFEGSPPPASASEHAPQSAGCFVGEQLAQIRRALFCREKLVSLGFIERLANGHFVVGVRDEHGLLSASA